MKKRTKIILLVLGIIVVVFAFIVIAFLKKIYGTLHIEIDSDIVEATNTIEASYEEMYSDRWIFNGVGISDEEHASRFGAKCDELEVHLSFECKSKYLYECVPISNESYEFCFDENMLENVSEIYKVVASVIRECLGSNYASYPLRISFVYPNGGGDISIICMDNCNTIKMECDSVEISLNDISKIFPEVNELEDDTGVDGYTFIKYDSIEEIAGFKELKVVDFGVLLPEADKEYILSIYPECEIVEKDYYKMKDSIFNGTD